MQGCTALAHILLGRIRLSFARALGVRLSRQMERPGSGFTPLRSRGIRPKMAKAATGPNLQALSEVNLEEAKGLVEMNPSF
jgi:hypothetical protein